MSAPKKASAAKSKAKPSPKASEPPRYHHGALKQALLAAAERVLRRDGLAGLTLRAAAREAGVSHAAPKNHFGDLRGLLSDLAALGFTRLQAAQSTEAERQGSAMPRLNAIGIGYVKFAHANPALFTLMFRSEQLDFSRPSLAAASTATFRNFSGTGGAGMAQPAGAPAQPLTLEQVARLSASWSLVHGFAFLMIDGRLAPLLRGAGGAVAELDVLAAIMGKGPGSPTG